MEEEQQQAYFGIILVPDTGIGLGPQAPSQIVGTTGSLAVAHTALSMPRPPGEGQPFKVLISTDRTTV